VLSDKRLPSMPNVPTMSEAGLPGFVDSNLVALMAPRGTPQAIVDKLHQASVAALKSPTLLESWQRLYIIPFGSTPQQLSQYLSSETAKYRELAQTLGLQPE